MCLLHTNDLGDQMIKYSLVLQACLGLGMFLLLPWYLSENRQAINFKQAFTGLGFQVALAIVLTKIEMIRNAFLWLGSSVKALRDATLAGTSFVFGYLGGGETPYLVENGKSTFIFAFQALPMAIVISALAMLLFHWRILPIIVNVFSKLFQKSLGIGGVLGVCMSAKIFLGQTEAPLVVKPYLNTFSRSELFTVMTAGMATTSVSVMTLYAIILEGTIPDPIAHILTASIIGIPAAITISRILIPQEGQCTSGDLVESYRFSNFMEALMKGINDGTRLYINILVVLIVFLAGISLINSLLANIPWINGEPMTLQLILGIILAPVAWLLGIPWDEAVIAGSLLGKKSILNEIVAFIDFKGLSKGLLSEKSKLIMVYALAGFANIGSIGIQISALGTLIPERKQEIINLGVKAMIAGSIASFMSAAIIGILYSLG
jgi:CNT family concentrative nucleoside transporter